MKIFVIPSWYPYSSNQINGTFFKEHAEKLQEMGHEVSVVTTEIISLKSFFKSRTDLGKKVYNENGVKTYQQLLMNHHPGNYPKFYERFKREFQALLKQVINKEGLPQLFHVHSSLWAGAALCEMDLGVPIVVSEHIKEFLINDGFDEFQHKLIQYTYDHIQALITPSQAVMDAIKDGFAIPETCTTNVIPNMVDSDFFIPAKNKNMNDRFTFLVVAMLRPEKQIDQIMQAFMNLGNNFLSKLVIVGDGPEAKSLLKLAHELSLARQIKFIHKTGKEEVLKNIQQADVCLLYSEMETFGVTLIEALSCGVPVIGGNVGGANDIITPENGLIVPTNNIQALQNAMKEMILHIDRYDPDTIRKDAIKRFDKKQVLKMLTKLYKELC